MNPKEITTDQLRQELKQYDQFWGYKPSKTIALLDPKFERLPDDDAELLHELQPAAQEIVDWFKSKNPEKYKYLTIYTLGDIYRKNKGDCENFADWIRTFDQMLRVVDDSVELERDFFTIIIPHSSGGTHAIDWGVSVGGYHKFFEPQNFTILPKKNILAVT